MFEDKKNRQLKWNSKIAIPICSFLFATTSYGQCHNALCASYDINLPTNILNSSPFPSLTVMGGNVGIGTNSPASILDIHATGANSAIVLPRDSTANRPVGQEGMIRYNTDLNQFEGFTLAGWGAIAGSSGASDWSTTNLGISYNAGAVGIGTNAPEGTLDVRGPLAIGSPDSQISNSNATIVAKSAGNPHVILEQVGLNTGGVALTSSDLVFGSELGGFIFRTGVDYNGNFTVTGNERVRITPSGKVGIGTATPSKELHVVGHLRVQGNTDCILGNGSGGTNCTSDIRLKTEIHEIRNALEKISRIRGVSFLWNEKSQTSGRQDIGVIAQDVEKVFPTAVTTDGDEYAYKRVDYAVLVAPMIEAMKELKVLNENQAQRIKALEHRLSEIENR